MRVHVHELQIGGSGSAVTRAALDARSRYFVVVNSNLLLPRRKYTADDVALLAGTLVVESEARHRVGKVGEIPDTHRLELCRADCGDGCRYGLRCLLTAPYGR